MRRAIMAALVAGGTLAQTVASQAGTVVVASDDWLASNASFTNFSTSATNYAQNIGSLFTGGGAGSFLVYADNPALDGSCCLGGSVPAGTFLRDAMEAAGHTWTIDTSQPLTLSYLEQFDGVFIGGAVNGDTSFYQSSTLTAYVAGGGGIYVTAGFDPNDNYLNPFLNQYGFSIDTTFNNVIPSIDVSSLGLTGALFNGVSSLSYNGGNYISLTQPAGPTRQLYADASGNGLWGVYQAPSPVPLPAGVWLLLSALGGLGFAGWRRKRAVVA
jgi:hypothetical protein